MKRDLLVNLTICAGVSLFGASALFFVFSFLKRPKLSALPSDALEAAHAGRLSKYQISDLRKEFANSFDFTDISFEEIPFEGKYVNKLMDGSRLSVFNSECASAPQERIVWVFGGSTTYGYGLPDSETIPSEIAKQLKNQTGDIWCVKNYARGYYYSSQELNLLIRFLRLNPRPPGTIIFVDGLNDFYHLVGSTFTPNSRLEDQDQLTKAAIALADFILKVAGRIQRMFNPDLSSAFPHVYGAYRAIGLKPTSPAECAELINGKSQGDVSLQKCQPFLRGAALGMLKNWEMASTLASAAGAQFIPVLQPIPSYPTDSRDLNPFIPVEGLSQHELSGSGYPIIIPKLNKQLNLSRLIVDDANGDKKCSAYYVDPVHYSNCAADLIAREIVQRITQ